MDKNLHGNISELKCFQLSSIQVSLSVRSRSGLWLGPGTGFSDMFGSLSGSGSVFWLSSVLWAEQDLLKLNNVFCKTCVFSSGRRGSRSVCCCRVFYPLRVSASSCKRSLNAASSRSTHSSSLTHSQQFLVFLCVSALLSHRRQEEEMECVKQDVSAAILVYFILTAHSLAGNKGWMSENGPRRSSSGCKWRLFHVLLC